MRCSMRLKSALPLVVALRRQQPAVCACVCVFRQQFHSTAALFSPIPQTTSTASKTSSSNTAGNGPNEPQGTTEAIIKAVGLDQKAQKEKKSASGTPSSTTPTEKPVEPVHEPEWVKQTPPNADRHHPAAAKEKRGAAFSTFSKHVQQDAKNAKDSAKESIKSTAEAVKSGVKSGVEAVQSGVKAGAEAVTNAVKGDVKYAKESMKSAAEAVKSGAETVKNNVKNAIDDHVHPKEQDTKHAKDSLKATGESIKASAEAVTNAAKNSIKKE